MSEVSVPLGRRRNVTHSVSEGASKKNFLDAIRKFASRKKEEHIFSGEHYEFLKDFLDQPSSRVQSQYSAQGANTFTPIYLHANDLNRSTIERKVYPCSSTDEFESFLPKVTPTNASSSLLVVLQGWQPGESLRVLVAQCGVDPELLRRHLCFLEPKNFYDLPPLPSRTVNPSTCIWRLRITTICHTEAGLRPEEVTQTRLSDAEELRAYLNELRMSQRAGNSIVRRWAALDETTTIVQQDVSCSVHQKKSGGWIGTVWLDSGRPFEENERQPPWLRNSNSSISGRDPYDAYVPLVCHLPKVVISPPASDAEPLGTATPQTRSARHPGRPPSSSLAMIPEQYGLTLDKDLACVDAFYALSEIITLAASSENQFVNLLQTHIDSSLRLFRGQEDWCIEKLQYIKVLLDETAERAFEVMHLLETEKDAKWPTSKADKDIAVRETVRKALLEDYRELHRRSTVLSQKVRDGTTFITTGVSARASRRSIDQAAEVNRIAILAYFFVPMSFVTSIFGMNVVEFGDLGWGVGTIFIVLAFVMVPSLLLGFWKSMPWVTSRGKQYNGISSNA